MKYKTNINNPKFTPPESLWELLYRYIELCKEIDKDILEKEAKQESLATTKIKKKSQ